MIVTIYSIFCDGVDCGQWIGQTKTLHEARLEARRAGWTRKRDPLDQIEDIRVRDYCPDCTKGTSDKNDDR